MSGPRRHARNVMCVMRSFLASALLSVWAAVSGCHDAGMGAIGAACVADGQCHTGFCWAGCRDPSADDDGDGLDNAVERRLGLSPIHADTDGDGLLDKDELGPGGVDDPRDTDGDGRIDALESMVDDADRDCLPDQLDPSHEQVALDELARLRCKSAGICAGIAVVARCDGGLTCDYGAVPGYEPIEVSCDGRDNDCDGEIDEGLIYVESTGALKVLGEACVGLGECADRIGMVECSAGGNIVCSVDRDGSESYGAPDDIDCDGLDNDCDGEIDEGISWLEPDTGLIKRYGEACRARGVCGLSAGVVECSQSGHGICSTEPGGSDDRSGPERCDGLDEDCDGRIDDEIGWRAPSGAWLSVGEPCGRGICAGTVVACAGGVATCPGLEAATEEVCNGLDDDCDGETDEAADVVRGCSVLGECAGREVIGGCEGGVLVCRYRDGDAYVLAPTRDEICDGRDEDCDGHTDEEVVDSDGGTKGAPCFGSGLCATVSGFLVCSGGGLVCSADAGLAEVCDGVDNDCDGLTDEEPVDRPLCAVAGVCAAVSADARCEEGDWVCPHEALIDYRAEEVADIDCDGLDNDCDGIVDEGSRRLPNGTIEVVMAAPPLRRASATCGGNDALWVHGGLDASLMASAELWRFTGQAWERRADGPALAGHALVFEPHAGRIYAHGGFTRAEQEVPDLGPDGPAATSMWVYDPVADRWDPVAQAFENEYFLPRRHHVLAALPKGQLLLHGGLGEVGAPEVLIGEIALGDEAVCHWSTRAWPGPGWRAGHAATVIERDRVPWVVLAGGTGAVNGWSAFSLEGVVSSLAGGPSGLTKVGLVVDSAGVVALAEQSFRLDWGTELESLVSRELSGGLTAPVVAGWVGAQAIGLSLGGGEAIEVADELVARADLARPAPRRGAALLLGDPPAELGASRSSGPVFWLVGGVRESDGAPIADAWVWRLPNGPWARVEQAEAPVDAVFTAVGGVLWAARREAAGVALWRLTTGAEARWQPMAASGVGPVAVTAIGALQVGDETSVFSVSQVNGALAFHEARIGAAGAVVWSARGEWIGAAGPLVVGQAAGAVMVAAHVGDDEVAVRRLDQRGLVGEPVILAGDAALGGGTWDPTRAIGYATDSEGLWVLEPDEATAVWMDVPGLGSQTIAHGPDGALWAFGAGLMRVPLVCE